MKTKLKTLATLCLLTSLAVNAEVAETKSGLYFGAFAGQASSDVTGSDFPSGTFDDSDTAFKFIAGYQFNDYISLEGGYTSLGEVVSYSWDETVSLPMIGAPSFDTHTDGGVEVDGIILNVIGSFPVSEQFSIYAKLGVFSWDFEIKNSWTITSSDPTTPTSKSSETFSDDGTDVFYGLGLAYHWDDISFRAEYELFESDGDEIDVFSIGAVYNF